MNVASKKLCEELYELSEWGKTEFREIIATSFAYFVFGDRSNANSPYLVEGRSNHYQREYGKTGEFTPAYDLGYLIRKLPARIEHDYPNDLEITKEDEEKYWCSYTHVGDDIISECGDTPEDATAKLCIQLFKQGILERATPQKEAKE